VPDLSPLAGLSQPRHEPTKLTCTQRHRDESAIGNFSSVRHHPSRRGDLRILTVKVRIFFDVMGRDITVPRKAAVVPSIARRDDIGEAAALIARGSTGREPARLEG
jgi:hypothetical protein